MTVLTFGMSPVSPFAQGAMADKHEPTETAGQLATVTALPVSLLNIIGKGDERRGGRIRVDFGDILGTNVPADSLITDAYFIITPSATNANLCTNISIALVAKDGLWDVLGGLSGVFSQEAPAADLRVEVNGVSGQWVTGVTEDLLAAPIRASLGAPAQRDQIGQLMTEASAITTLDDVKIHMREVGVIPSGDVFVDVYQWLTGPNRIDEGTGVIAVSDPVDAATGLPSGPHAAVQFDFSGGDRISWAANARRAFVVRTTAPISNENFVDLQYGTGDQYTPAGIVIAGEREGWGDALYPAIQSYPHLYEADDETIDVSPFGGDLAIIQGTDFPTFTDAVPVEVHPVNLHHLIQRWITDPGYVEGDPLSFYIVPFHTSTIGAGGRTYNDLELVVEFRPRDVFSG